MSAMGQKLPRPAPVLMSALPPESGHGLGLPRCPLWARSRHSLGIAVEAPLLHLVEHCGQRCLHFESLLYLVGGDERIFAILEKACH
jgi:hypothetical protein